MKNKTFKKILNIVLCCALVMSYVPMTSITAGAAAADITVTIDTGASVTLRDADGDDYYDIGTSDELYAFADEVNSGNTDINGELTADITLNQNVLTETGELNGDGSNFGAWTPIGNEDNRYLGTFDGGEHIVRGLYFNNSATDYVGMFGNVGSGGKVQNLGIVDSYISGNNHVGGVAGFTGNYSTITSCYNIGSVTGIGRYVGGVIGYNFGTITSCYNEGTVNGKDIVGGVTGFSNSNTTNCYNKGTVNGRDNVGGVVGFTGNYSTITSCYNIGSVTGIGRYVGGVVGYNTATVTDCYNTGSVSAVDNVGGVAGYNTATVTNCYNTGSVNATDNVGGVAGYSGSYSTVTSCYNTGSINGKGHFVGGVLGKSGSSDIAVNCYYLIGCATDGNNATQLGVGNENADTMTPDITGRTDSKTDDWFASGEVCTAVGYHAGSGAANGFCDLCSYLPATLNADGYYEISNAGQLFWFGNYINTVDRTANAILTADIDLEGKALSPIGKAANKYQGVFDGQGHTISNFNITITGAGNWGLFGYVTGEGTVIKNFSISGDVTTALTSNVEVQYGVVGQADGTAQIINVHSSVNLTSKDSYQKKYFGGIVGRSGNITIERCSFSGKLSLGSNTLDCAGGILGYSYNGKTTKITDCGFYGSIESTYSSGNIGGILGYYNGENAKALTISNCLSIGTLPSGRGAILGTLNNYGSTNAGTNNYYISPLNHTITNATANVVTQAQLEIGEAAFALGDAWGQNINNGETNPGYPIIGGTAVYRVTNCLGNTDYSNTDAIRHASNCIFSNGAYSQCGEFDPESIVDGVYQIATAEQLVAFAKTVNKGETEINAKLINNIDLTGYEWTPIGTAEKMYSGTFDGNGKSITVQFSYIGAYNDEKPNYSLFAYVDSAKICKLTVKGSIDVRGIYAAGIVSQTYGYVVIEKCISDVDIITRGYTAYASGLVGRADGILDISNCGFTGSMSNPEQSINSSGFVSDATDTSEVYISSSFVAADFSNYKPLSFDSAETFVKSSGRVSYSNCFYRDALNGNPVSATQKTAEQFASGEVAFFLRGGSTNQLWGQMSNTEGSLPVLTDNELYRVTAIGETGLYRIANVGDTNQDTTVDAEDYQALVNSILSDGHEQTGTAGYNDIVRYDINGDGYLDVTDALLIERMINGQNVVEIYAVGDINQNGIAFEEAEILLLAEAMEAPEALTTHEKYSCDLNGDGKVSYDDFNILTSMFPLYFVGEG